MFSPRNAHEYMKETHADLQISSDTDKHRSLHAHKHLHTCTDTWRNVRNAGRKDEGQWEYKEVHLLRGEEKQGNKTVTSSQEFADGTHTYTQVERDKRESVR